MAELTYNSDRRRYLSPKGKEVEPMRVREWVLEAKEKARERMRGYAEDYKSGKINRSQFFVSLNEELTKAHSAVGMIASGGREAMDASKWGFVGKRVAEQRSFSRGFHAESLTMPREEFPVWRAESYAKAIGQTYEQAVWKREKDAGAKSIRRVLGPAEQHCATCPGLAGTFKIEDVTLPGHDCDCGGGCRCYLVEVTEVEA